MPNAPFHWNIAVKWITGNRGPSWPPHGWERRRPACIGIGDSSSSALRNRITADGGWMVRSPLNIRNGNQRGCRAFVKTAAIASAVAVACPMVLSRDVQGAKDRIRMGACGVRSQGNGLMRKPSFYRSNTTLARLTGVQLNILELLYPGPYQLPAFGGIKYSAQKGDDFHACVEFADSGTTFFSAVRRCSFPGIVACCQTNIHRDEGDCPS